MIDLHTASEYIIPDFLLEQWGTSRSISCQNYTGKQVAKQVKELLFHPSYALRAAEVAAILQVEDDIATACNVIKLKSFGKIPAIVLL